MRRSILCVIMNNTGSKFIGNHWFINYNFICLNNIETSITDFKEYWHEKRN